jgi:hypothetical protein
VGRWNREEMSRLLLHVSQAAPRGGPQAAVANFYRTAFLQPAESTVQLHWLKVASGVGEMLIFWHFQSAAWMGQACPGTRGLLSTWALVSGDLLQVSPSFKGRAPREFTQVLAAKHI